MYLLHQAFTVPLNRFSPDESVLVGFGFDLCPVNVFHIQADEAFGREKKYGLRKHLVDFLLHPVAVDGQVVIRPMMYLALSYDHRLIDGRESVGFLVAIRDLLEDPTRLLLEI